MLNIDIESLIPHRKKIKVIHGILDIQEDTAVTCAIVDDQWPLYEEGSVDSLVLIEAIAQTAAVIEGYKRRVQGKPAAGGWLVGIKSAAFFEERIPVETNLLVFLERRYSFENYGVVEGVVRAGEKILATATLQAMLLENDRNA